MTLQFHRHSTIARAGRVSVAAAILAITAACGGTATSTSPIFTTDLEPGTVVTGAPGFNTLSFKQASNVQIVLSSLDPDTGVSVGVGIGVPPADGSVGCQLDDAQLLRPGQSFTLSEDAGLHCIAVFESLQNGVGAIPDPLAYVVKVNHH